jgi:hypothetical protein
VTLWLPGSAACRGTGRDSPCRARTGCR